MKFSTREDVSAPIEYVFQCVTDFSAFERSALRRGADIQRKDNLKTPGVGVAWRISFPFRGKTRTVAANVQDFDQPNRLEIFSCLLYTSPSPRDGATSRMPSSA